MGAGIGCGANSVVAPTAAMSRIRKSGPIIAGVNGPTENVAEKGA
jgi:hypothetical protein